MIVIIRNRILYKTTSKMCILATLNKFAILNIEEYTESDSESSNTSV